MPKKPVQVKTRKNFARPIAISIVPLIVVVGLVLWYQHKPLTAEQHLELAKEYAAKGNGALAMHEYENAILLNKKLIPAYLGMEKQQEAIGNLGAAADILGVIPHYQPNYPHILCRRAQLYGMVNRFETAYKLAKEAVEKEPDCPVAHNDLGMLLEQVGDDKGAASELGKSYKYAPTDEALGLDYARCLALAGKPDNALLIVEDILPKTKMFKVQANYLEGWILCEYGRGGHIERDTGIQHLGMALVDNPDHTASLTEIGHIYLKQGRTTSATEELEHAFHKGPDTIELIDDLVVLYRQTASGKLQEAESVDAQLREIILPLKKARRRFTANPNDLDNLVVLARAEVRVHNDIDALELLRQVLAKQPNNKDALDLYKDMTGPRAPVPEEAAKKQPSASQPSKSKPH